MNALDSFESALNIDPRLLHGQRGRGPEHRLPVPRHAPARRRHSLFRARPWTWTPDNPLARKKLDDALEKTQAGPGTFARGRLRHAPGRGRRNIQPRIPARPRPRRREKKEKKKRRPFNQPRAVTPRPAVGGQVPLPQDPNPSSPHCDRGGETDILHLTSKSALVPPSTHAQPVSCCQPMDSPSTRADRTSAETGMTAVNTPAVDGGTPVMPANQKR